MKTVIRETVGSTTKTKINVSQRMQPHRGRRKVMEYGLIRRTAQRHLGIDEKTEIFYRVRDLDVCEDFFWCLLGYNTTVLLRNYPEDEGQSVLQNLSALRGGAAQMTVVVSEWGMKRKMSGRTEQKWSLLLGNITPLYQYNQLILWLTDLLCCFDRITIEYAKNLL